MEGQLCIYYIKSDQTIQFAACELARYLRRVVGDIRIQEIL